MNTVKDISKEIEKFAPKYLMEDYDNVGLMVGRDDKHVSKVLLALDCTNDVIREAIENNADMIISHHPLLFKKPKSITTNDLLGNKIISLIKEDISLYSCHTNLDSTKNGINDVLVNLLGFKSSLIIDEKESENGKCGIGRLIRLEEPMSLDDLVSIIKNKLDIKGLRVAKGSDKVNTIAVINGSGQDYFYEAKKLGADCIITGDTTYHFVSDFKEMNISIIDAGHFKTEYLAFLKTLDFLKEKFKDIEFIKSETNKDPYEIV